MGMLFIWKEKRPAHSSQRDALNQNHIWLILCGTGETFSVSEGEIREKLTTEVQ